MNPILASGALSMASDLVQSLAPKPKATAAESAPFAELLARITASPQMQQARWLEARGLHTADQAQMRVHTLTEELLQSPELHAATAGSGEAFTLSFQPDGRVAVRTADGRERTVTLSEEGQAAATEIRGICEAHTNGRGGAVLRVTPGERVSFAN